MSGYNEWQQTYVLAGEVVETAKINIFKSPLPYFAGVLAARSLLVVADPLHFMYGKVNKFLNKGPRWNVTKLPSYWVYKILLNPPTDDDAHHREVEWLLDALIDGLRTAAVRYTPCPTAEAAELFPGLRNLPRLSYFRTPSFALSIAVVT